MAKKKQEKCPEGVPAWLVTFGDLMALLLVFFVLLLSMAIFDKKKVEEYFDVMRRSMGIMENSDALIKKDTHYEEDSNSSDSDQSEESAESVSEDIQQAVKSFNQSSTTYENDSEETVSFDKGYKEMIIDIPSSLLFGSGEYEINNQKAKKFIAKLSRIIKSTPTEYNVEVIGHTDSGSFSSSDLPRDNWDMSVLRSISVMKELLKNRMDPALMKVAGYAEYRPKSDSDSANRRVEIRLYHDKSGGSSGSDDMNFFDNME